MLVETTRDRATVTVKSGLMVFSVPPAAASAIKFKRNKLTLAAEYRQK